jgi:hypothetical protein
VRKPYESKIAALAAEAIFFRKGKDELMDKR